MSLHVGAAKVDITPPMPCRLAGYAARNKPHEGVHSPLSLRALYARDGAGSEGCIISADLIWFGAAACRQVRDLLKSGLGLPKERLLLAGTHTHSAPDDGNAAYLDLVAGRAAAAATAAKSWAKPVTLRWASGSSGIGVNRRERTAGGSIRLGRNPAGPVDRELIAAAFDGEDGKPVAHLANFACHGVVLGQDSHVVSGDWPGTAAQTLESRHGGAPFLFLNGGAGNVNPTVGPQNDTAEVERLAAEFVADFESTLKAWNPLEPGGSVQGVIRFFDLPSKADPHVKRPVTVHGLQLGGVTIVGFPGEVFSETAIAVKKDAHVAPLMVCSYVDESESGYVPVKEAYDEGGYEVEVSPYGPGAEKVLYKRLVGLGAGLGEDA